MEATHNLDFPTPAQGLPPSAHPVPGGGGRGFPRRSLAWLGVLQGC